MKSYSSGIAEATTKIFQLKGESTEQDVLDQIIPVIPNRLITDILEVSESASNGFGRDVLLLGFVFSAITDAGNKKAHLELTKDGESKKLVTVITDLDGTGAPVSVIFPYPILLKSGDRFSIGATAATATGSANIFACDK